MADVHYLQAELHHLWKEPHAAEDSDSVVAASEGELTLPESLAPAVYLHMNRDFRALFDTVIVTMDHFEATVAHVLFTHDPYICTSACPGRSGASRTSATQQQQAGDRYADSASAPAICCRLAALLQRAPLLDAYLHRLADRYGTDASQVSLPFGASLCISPSYLQMRLPCTLEERSVRVHQAAGASILGPAVALQRINTKKWRRRQCLNKLLCV